MELTVFGTFWKEMIFMPKRDYEQTARINMIFGHNKTHSWIRPQTIFKNPHVLSRTNHVSIWCLNWKPKTKIKTKLFVYMRMFCIFDLSIDWLKHLSCATYSEIIIDEWTSEMKDQDERYSNRITTNQKRFELQMG